MKANLDIAAAKAFMSYLEGEGALCSIVSDSGQVVARSAALAATMPGRPAQGNSQLSLADTAPPSQDFVSPVAPIPTPVPTPADDPSSLPLVTPPPPEDALSDASSGGAFRLETLDGATEEESASDSQSSRADTSDVAAFLPPEMLNETSLELAEGPPTPAPPEDFQSPEQTPSEDENEAEHVSAPRGAEQPMVSPAMPPHQRALALLVNQERLRFAVGMVLAVFLGFAVVNVFASSRESSRYTPVIAELEAEYQAANSMAAWAALDQARADTVKTLESRRKNIVIVSLGVWLLVGGLFAFLWLRVIPWRALNVGHPTMLR